MISNYMYDYSAKEVVEKSEDSYTLFESKPSSQFLLSTKVERKIDTAISNTVTEAITQAIAPLIEKLEVQAQEIYDLKIINNELLIKVNDNKTSYVGSKGISRVVFIAIIVKLLLIGFLIMNGKFIKLY